MTLRRKLFIAGGTVLTLAILIPVIHHYRLRAVTDAYLAQLKASGEPMELAQVIPPPLPPERNSAPLFWRAVSLLNTNSTVLTTNNPSAMRMVAPGKAMIGWMRPDIRSGNASNSWEEVKSALAQDHEALSLLGQLTNNSAFDFHLQYERRFEMVLTNLTAGNKVVKLLCPSAVYNLHTGDTASAVSNVQTMLILINGTDDQRTVLFELLRIAVTQIASATTWEILQSTNVTDAQLASLQEAWSQPEFIHSWEHSLPLEREGALTTFFGWRNTSSKLSHYLDQQKNLAVLFDESDSNDSIFDKIKMQAKIFLWRYWWSYSDELLYLKGFEVLTDTARMVETNGSFLAALNRQNARLDQLGISELTNSLDSSLTGQTDFRSMLSDGIVSIGLMGRKLMQVEVTKQITTAAIALKRYQKKYGNYAASLESLVPEFIAKTPIDPVDSKPLRYRIQPDGAYLLYSVGPNGIDDGGNPEIEKKTEQTNFNWQNPQALDWVWPQPAAPDENRNSLNPKLRQ